MEQEALKAAIQKRKNLANDNKFSVYQNDPLGFCEDVLGERFTDSVKLVIKSVQNNPVTIAKSANATGKSHVAARLALWFYLCFPNSKVFITSAPPEANLKRILWGEIMSVVQKHPSLFDGHNIKSLEISRSFNWFIAGVTIPTSGSESDREAKFSGKHASHMMFLVDEGDAVPDEVYRGIESCTSGGVYRMLIMFNPRAQRGPVYLKERNGSGRVVRLNAFDHPNVVTGQNVIPGAVDRDTTVRRILDWSRPMVTGERITNECFEVPGFLVGHQALSLDGTVMPPLSGGWRKITESAFYYMVLGKYPAQSAAQLISDSWVDQARTRWDLYVARYGERPPVGVAPLMGVDIAELGGDFNVACLRYGGFVPKFQTWQGMDVHATGGKILNVYRETLPKPVMIFVDGDGIGSSVAPQVTRTAKQEGENIRALSVKAQSKPLPFIKTEIGEFFGLRDQLWWALREWLRTDQTAMLPPDELLIEELRVPTYEVREDGKIKITKKDEFRSAIRRSPDRADALCLTFCPQRKAKVRLLMS